MDKVFTLGKPSMHSNSNLTYQECFNICLKTTLRMDKVFIGQSSIHFFCHQHKCTPNLITKIFIPFPKDS